MKDSLRTDLNDFLFTPIASDSNGMHLTMLSALARAGVDPWAEAASLASLSRESATEKLVLMLAGVPNGPPPGEDTASLAARLVAQLHASPKPSLKPMPASKAGTQGGEVPLLTFAALPKLVRLSIYSLAALIFMIMCYRVVNGWVAATPAETDYNQAR
jgi:hypothetical protein